MAYALRLLIKVLQKTIWQHIFNAFILKGSYFVSPIVKFWSEFIELIWLSFLLVFDARNVQYLLSYLIWIAISKSIVMFKHGSSFILLTTFDHIISIFQVNKFIFINQYLYSLCILKYLLKLILQLPEMCPQLNRINNISKDIFLFRIAYCLQHQVAWKAFITSVSVVERLNYKIAHLFLSKEGF